MDRARTNHFIKRSVLGAAVALLLLLVGWLPAAYAQEPPLDVPKVGRLTKPTDVMSLGGWLIYPQVRGFGLWSDNLFQTVADRISTAGYGVAPMISAEWSNGIHTTTLYGNLERRVYPAHGDINTFDRQAGFTQRYEALRDLNFQFQSDYTHRTNANGLIGGIPGAVGAPATVALPNGNFVLPNGNIVDSTGNVVGQSAPGLNVVAANNVLVNPYDQYTATATVEKYLNRGLLRLSGSLARTDYESNQTSPDFGSKTVRGYVGFWLGPVFYAYSDVAMAWLNFDNSAVGTAFGTSTYRAVGGLGTSHIGLWRAVAYGGHQGSHLQIGTAEGDVYGSRLSYDPTPYLTFSASVERTYNIASQGAFANIAQVTATPTPIVVSASTSTRTTATFVDANYSLSREWSAYARFGFTEVKLLDSPRIDNAWLADVVLRYEIRKNLTASWEYQYTSIISNFSVVDTHRNLYTASLNYKF